MIIDTIKTFLGAAPRAKPAPPPVFQSAGQCPICKQQVVFAAYDPWLRDHFRCSNCQSIPRERALMATIERYFPNWRELTIHESSPSPRGASKRLADECPNYIASQYYPDKEPGSMVVNQHAEPDSKVKSFRAENLEALSFADASIDLHITQDVMEHVFHPDRVFREVARTLKPGGAHIFTVPIVTNELPSRRRARLEADGQITYLLPADYHGNPISEEGSLVTMDWGYDICRHIFEASGLFTTLVYIDDLSQGIRAALIEVLVTTKPVGQSQSLD